MKRFSILASSLLTLSLTAVTPTALAGEVAAVSKQESATSEIQPFNLVHRAYSGHFSEQGIPGFSGLATAYQSGQVKAADLVEVAINQGRLSEKTLNNEGYLNAVDSQLRNLRINGYRSND